MLRIPKVIVRCPKVNTPIITKYSPKKGREKIQNKNKMKYKRNKIILFRDLILHDFRSKEKIRSLPNIIFNKH